MTILVIGGIAGVSLVSQVTDTTRRAQWNDRRIQDASHVMDRVTLWSRSRLLAALGQRRWPTATVDIQQLSPTLFRIRVQDPITRGDLLTTVVYRRLDAN